MHYALTNTIAPSTRAPLKYFCMPSTRAAATRKRDGRTRPDLSLLDRQAHVPD
jgi:hypothetical protein